MSIVEQLQNLKWSEAPSKMTFGDGMQIADIGVHRDHTITVIGDAEAIKHFNALLGVERTQLCASCKGTGWSYQSATIARKCDDCDGHGVTRYSAAAQ